MRVYPTFGAAIEGVGKQLRDQSYEVKTLRWQSSDISDKPGATMREVLNVSFKVPMHYEDLGSYRRDIEPNLPWADDHFEERVSGVPWNPGEQWRNWPWALSADNHRKEKGGKFSHTYMERYWPKYANEESLDRSTEYSDSGMKLGENLHPRTGIRYNYGDLGDVVNHLAKDPLTRQAFLPVWFPEDTGVVHGERVPCTLGYHFILRNGFFHHTYYIRSCDFYRHFRDDLYLSARLHLWVLDQLRKGHADRGGMDWNMVKPGFFTFHCVSMHCFIADWQRLFGKAR